MELVSNILINRTLSKMTLLRRRFVKIFAESVNIFYFSCSPFELFNSVRCFLFSFLAERLSGQCPLSRSSFRRSTASDALLVAGHCAVPHEIEIRRGSRAAFTLSQYSPLPKESFGFGGCKRPVSPVIGEPFLTGLSRLSKGLDKATARTISLLRIFPVKINNFCIPQIGFFRLAVVGCIKTACEALPYYTYSSLRNSNCCSLFKFISMSFKSHLVSPFKRFVRIAACLIRRLGDNHLPDYPNKSSCHSGSCLAFNTDLFTKVIVFFFKVGIKLGCLKSGFTQSPSQGRRSGFRDASGVVLPVGDVASLCETCPAGYCVGVFEPLEISDFSDNDKPEHEADSGYCSYNIEPLLQIGVCGKDVADFSFDIISLLLDELDSVLVRPYNERLGSVKLRSMGEHITVYSCGREFSWSSFICPVELPFSLSFDFSGFLCDGMPLSCELSEVSYFSRRSVCCGYMFVFHNVGDFACGDFVGVSHSRSQLAQIECIDEVDLFCDWFEHIPEPIVASHRFDADAERFGQSFHEPGDFAGEVVGDGLLFCFSSFRIKSGIRSRCSV